MNDKVTDDSVAAWLRELGYRASDGDLPTRSTVSGVADVATDPLQFLMERYRSKSKTQNIKRYMELLDNSSDPHKADTLRKLSAAAKTQAALDEGAAKANALSAQIKDLNVRRAILLCACIHIVNDPIMSSTVSGELTRADVLHHGLQHRSYHMINLPCQPS